MPVVKILKGLCGTITITRGPSLSSAISDVPRAGRRRGLLWGGPFKLMHFGRTHIFLDSMSKHQATGRWAELLAHPAAPIGLTLFSDLAFVMMDGTVQAVESSGMPAGQVVFVRMAVTAWCCGTYLLYAHPELLPTVLEPDSRLLWLRGTNNALNLCLLYASLHAITLSETVTIIHLRPFPVIFLCWYFIGEKIRGMQIGACVVSFGAVLLVVRPEFLFSESISHDTLDRGVGLALMVLCMLTSAVDIMLLRKIGMGVDPVLILFVYCLSAIVVGPVWMILSRTPIAMLAPLSAWLSLVLVALTGLVGQVTLVMALQRESGGKIAILGYFQIVFSVVIQLCFTGTLPSFEAAIGMSIIIGAGVCSAMQSSREQDLETIDEEIQLDSGALRTHTESTFGYIPVNTDDRSH